MLFRSQFAQRRCVLIVADANDWSIEPRSALARCLTCTATSTTASSRRLASVASVLAIIITIVASSGDFLVSGTLVVALWLVGANQGQQHGHGTLTFGWRQTINLVDHEQIGTSRAEPPNTSACISVADWSLFLKLAAVRSSLALISTVL